ncbi:cytochrome P450 [Russula earlei]|uniref:Cytochrome P450 n=1 Tax=Russula earlei TaxID=71964 RepID=A0ACC0UE46_9AGAM|nr:cytochrome P450 [Russula earlei]
MFSKKSALYSSRPLTMACRAVGAIILRISHGYRPKPDNDPMVRITDQAATDHLNLILSPGRFLVDVFPFLRFIPEWLPGGGVHKVAREMKHTLIDLTNQSYQFAEDRIAKGTAVPSFVSTMLDGRKVSPEEEHEIKWAASSLYTGGADTPVLATASFLLAMTMHPDIQKKAQAELDAVVGNDRLPTLGDRDSLPYLNTMIKEAIRWGPTTPLGAPHCIEQDDVHEGYFIPKGSIVMANIWWFMHDPEVYKNPMEFDPERLIAKPGKPAELDPFGYAFGYGRR